MNDAFQLVAHYFTQRQCKACNEYFAQNDVELVSQETDALVVRVCCGKCNQPLGIALIGLTKAQPAEQAKPKQRKKMPWWTATDRKRLKDLPPITADDCLEFHQKLKALLTAQK